jgi:D-apionolactonase
MLTDEYLMYGAAIKPAALVTLRAGPVQLSYDAGTGSLRWFKRGGTEIVRGIYFALRDRNWGTVPGQLIERERVIGPDSFRIEFECEHRQTGIHFAWRGLIEGSSDGSVRYACDGVVRGTFLKNRIGFCLLHPIRECAGARARQIRTSGEVIEGTLPRAIEPQIFGKASFQDLRALAHEVEPGLWAELTFEGEVFEMEDQRNWTDASFKTYGTPLARPFPVEMKPGERVRQVITLRWIEDPGSRGMAMRHEDPELVTLEWPRGGESRRMPELGLGLASESLSEREIERIGALRLSHARHDVRLAHGSWVQDLERAVEQSKQLRVPLELAVHLPRTGASGLPALRELLERSTVGSNGTRSIARRILVLREGEAATTDESLFLARGTLGELGVPFGVGSDCNFCELNREQALGRIGLEGADCLFWSINPQVHTVDPWSVMETLEAQGETVRTARAFAGGRPLMVSPVTLKQRFNPVATGPEPALAPGALPSQVDPRQLSLFAAAWTVGSLCTLAEAGVASITYFEMVGWRGIMAQEKDAQHGPLFPAEPGMVFPVYLVFMAVSGFSRWVRVSSSDPRRMIGFGLQGEGIRRRLVLANLTEQPLETQVHGLDGAWRARYIDLQNCRRVLPEPATFWAMAGGAMELREGKTRLKLPGYAVVVMDGERESSI